MSASDIVSKLEFCRQVSPDSWMARCPAHDDRGPSLSIKDAGGGRTLIHCFAGCGATEVLDAIGLEWDALYPPQDRHHYATTQKRRQETEDELVISIARSDMAKGVKLSDEDKARYSLALLREGVL